jgi:hypothetical protein
VFVVPVLILKTSDEALAHLASPSTPRQPSAGPRGLAAVGKAGLGKIVPRLTLPEQAQYLVPRRTDVMQAGTMEREHETSD